VLLRRSALGDVVLLGAVTSRVARPVTVVTDPRWAPVAARLSGVDRVVPWDGAIQGGGPRIDLQAGHGSARFRPDRTIDKRGARRRFRMWTGLVAPRPPVVSLYAEACGIAEPAPPPWIDGGGARDALAVLPGAAWATKRWAPERFRELSSRWNGPVVVADIVVEAGFERTIAALLGCRVAVGCDSGLLHLAGACGARAVAVFGSTHPDDGFFTWPGEAVQRELSCRPCTLHGRSFCPLGDALCLDVPVDAVWGAVRRAWDACAG
jgi:ADP-heptose:LPS heptosyltransferase